MEVEFSIGGRTLRLSAEQVRHSLRGVTPGPIRAHAVEVDGQLHPVKEAFARSTGLDLLDFNTNTARRMFQKLGFSVRRES